MFQGEFGKRKEALAKLSNELERQAVIYQKLGVNKDIIMRLVAPRPDRLQGYLNIPVVTLGTSVELGLQAGLAGIDTFYDLSRGYDTAGGITYGEPHLVWMQDGRKFLGKSVEWVRSHLARNERPATQYDGVALAIVHVDFRTLLRDHAIDLPGTAVRSDYAPCLDDWAGRPKLDHRFVGLANPDDGSASCGS